MLVIVVDLDRFKDINDTFGHAAGDKVLARCARQIRSVVHHSTLVARVGGEEFVVVALAGGREQRRLDQKAEKIRLAIAAPTEHPVTASIGATRTTVGEFAASGLDHEAVLDDVIARADRAMFQAKRNGGNTSATS